MHTAPNTCGTPGNSVNRSLQRFVQEKRTTSQLFFSGKFLNKPFFVQLRSRWILLKKKARNSAPSVFIGKVTPILRKCRFTTPQTGRHPRAQGKKVK